MSASKLDRHHPNPAELEAQREAVIANVGAQVAQAICLRVHELGSH